MSHHDYPSQPPLKPLNPQYDRWGELKPPRPQRTPSDEFDRTLRIVLISLLIALGLELGNLFLYVSQVISNPLPGIVLGMLIPAVTILVRLGWEELNT